MAFNGVVAAIPLGELGLTGNENHSQVGPGSLLEATNVAFDTGSVTKEGGSVRLNPGPLAGGASILSGFNWSPDETTDRAVIYAANGAQYMDYGDGSFSTALASSLATAPRSVPVWVEGGAESAGANKHLFLANGTNPPYQVDGSSTSLFPLSAPPADWATVGPITLCLHNNRLWGLKDHRVYYSQATDHTNFTGAGSGQIAVYPGEGQYGIQLMSFKGLLIVWKYPQGIYAVNTTAVDPANWTVSRISGTIGTASTRSAVMIDDDVLFLDQGGNVQLLSGIQEYGNLGSRNLSQVHKMGDFVRQNVNLSRLAYAQTVYYAAKREVHIALASSGSLVNDRRLVVDFNSPQTPRFRWSTKDTCQALWLQNDIYRVPRPYSGDNVGHVWKLDQEPRTKTGSSYNGIFQTAHTDLSFLGGEYAARRKEGRFLELTVAPRGTWTIYVDVYWDGRYTQTIPFDYGSGGFVLDQDQLDVDVLGGVVPGAGIQLGVFVLGTHSLAQWLLATVKKRLAGGGKRVSFKIYTAENGSDFSIGRALLYFKPGNERTLR